jgi:hypothetical protein
MWLRFTIDSGANHSKLDTYGNFLDLVAFLTQKNCSLQLIQVVLGAHLLNLIFSLNSKLISNISKKVSDGYSVPLYKSECLSPLT